jgi:hypothetical protein
MTIDALFADYVAARAVKDYVYADLLKETLEDEGFTVQVLRGGDVALRLYRDYAKSVKCDSCRLGFVPMTRIEPKFTKCPRCRERT